MIASYRRHPSYAAFLLHRLSGVILVLFLPFHFLVLGLALESEAALDGPLGWFQQPLVKLFESGLVVLLAAHLAGGLRLLAVTLLPAWRWQRAAIGGTAGFALLAGVLFLINAA